MADKIDYQAYNDHDLLVMAVMQGNDTVGQQEKIVKQLELLNGTVKSDHAWLCALRYAVYVIIIILLGSITAVKVGVW